MGRSFFSAAGGVLLPVAYCIITWPLFELVRNNAVKRILGAPIGWPAWLYNSLFTDDPHAWWPPPGFFIALYGSNFLLYSLLTYAVLKWRGIPERPL